MAISFNNFNTLANTALDFYIKDQPVGQNIQDKPLLRALSAAKKAFPGGQGYVSGPVQGAFASDQAGFFQWFSHTDQVSFVHPDNILRAKFLWREAHAGIVLDFTELKQRGIGVDMSGAPVRSTNEEIQIVKDWLAAVMEDDFGESVSRALWDAFWRDGSQSAKAVVGLTGLIDDDPTTGLVGSLDRSAYSWWRHYVGGLGLQASEANQTLTKGLRRGIRQQRRYGGRPDLLFAGSAFIEAAEAEIQAKGSYTLTGFQGDKADVAIGKDPEHSIFIRGVGWIEYEPWLDDHGQSKSLFALDSRHIKYMPMKGQETMAHKAVRPFDQFVLFKSVTSTFTMSVDKLNCHGKYSIA